MVQKGNGILARLFAFRLHPKRVTTWWVTGYWLLCIPEHQISTSLESRRTNERSERTKRTNGTDSSRIQNRKKVWSNPNQSQPTSRFCLFSELCEYYLFLYVSLYCHRNPKEQTQLISISRIWTFEPFAWTPGCVPWRAYNLPTIVYRLSRISRVFQSHHLEYHDVYCPPQKTNKTRHKSTPWTSSKNHERLIAFYTLKQRRE